MPPYHAANLSLRLSSSPLLPTLTRSLIHRSCPDARDKASALQEALHHGDLLAERTISWTVEQNEPGQMWTSQSRLGFLGSSGDVPFMCVGAEAPNAEQDANQHQSYPSNALTPSLTSLGSSASPAPGPSLETRRTVAVGSNSMASPRGKTNAATVALAGLISNNVTDSLQSNPQKAGPGLPATSIAISPQQESMTTLEAKALTVELDLSPGCFNRSRESTAVQDIKVDIFLNGQLAHCAFVPARLRTAVSELHLRFSGRRIGRISEKAWVLRTSPMTNSEQVENTGKLDATHLPVLEKRWDEICEGLRAEAAILGFDAKGCQPPSAELLRSMAKMKLPDALAQASHRVSQQFATVDVIITIGHGKKFAAASHHILAPQRMFDEKFTTLETKPFSSSILGDVHKDMTSDAPSWATKALPPVTQRSNGRNSNGRASIGFLDSARNAVVQTPPSARFPRRIVLSTSPNKPVTAADRLQAASNALSQQNLFDPPKVLRSQEVRADAPQDIQRPIGLAASPRLPYNMQSPRIALHTTRSNSPSWSFRESYHGAKTPVLDPVPANNLNGKHTNSSGSSRQSVAVIIPIRSTSSSGRSSFGGKGREVRVVVPALNSATLRSKPPVKKRKIDLRQSGIMSTSSSPLARFADATLLPESPTSSVNAGGSPISNIRAMLSDIKISPSRSCSSPPTPKSPLQRLARRAGSFTPDLQSLGPPSTLITDGVDAETTLNNIASGNQLRKVQDPASMPSPVKTRMVVFKLRSGSKNDHGMNPSKSEGLGTEQEERKELFDGDPDYNEKKAATPTSGRKRGRKPRLHVTTPLQNASETRKRKRSMATEQTVDLTEASEGTPGAYIGMEDTPKPQPTRRFEVPAQCVNSIVGYATAEESGYMHVAGEYGVRQIGAERSGEFSESEVLVGVRFIVAAWD